MANEKRLIDADHIKELMLLALALSGKDTFTKSDLEYSLDNAPTEDAVEVVHGHWCWEGQFKACSKCGSYVEWSETLGASFWKFCPYCGAKMDGGTNESYPD